MDNRDILNDKELWRRFKQACLLVQQGAPRRLAFSSVGITEETLTEVLSIGASDLHTKQYFTLFAKGYMDLYKSELSFFMDTISTIPEARSLDIIKTRFPWVHMAKPSEIEIEYGQPRMDQSKLELGSIKEIISSLQNARKKGDNKVRSSDD